jgi:hypothetical protein
MNTVQEATYPNHWLDIFQGDPNKSNICEEVLSCPPADLGGKARCIWCGCLRLTVRRCSHMCRGNKGHSAIAAAGRHVEARASTCRAQERGRQMERHLCMSTAHPSLHLRFNIC